MSDNRNHIKKYSLTDIEQYLQGKLSSAEMHEMEKAAVQDPFLADAMEGYQASDLTKTNEDLAAIRLQLLQQVDEKPAPIILLNTQRNNWLRAAVVIFILAGSSTLAWFLFKSEPQKKEIAKQVIPSIKKETPQALTATITKPAPVSKQKADVLAEVSGIKKHADSNALLQENAAKETALLASRLESKRSTKTEINQDTLSDKIAVENPLSLNSQTLSLAKSVTAIDAGKYKAELSQTVSANSKITSLGGLSNLTVSGQVQVGTVNSSPLSILKGKVVDVNNHPISAASVSLEKSKQITNTDTAGFFTLQVKDSTSKIKIQAVGFEEVTAQLKPSDANKIILNDASGALSEVVVVGYQAQRKKDVTGSVSSIQKVTEQKLQPEIGWDSLRTYLRKKINYDNKDKKMMHGIIEVIISVKKSRVTDVEIVKSFDDSINRKLIQALKDGPIWISKENTAKKQKEKIMISL